MVKGELGLWEQVVPAVRGERDVGGRKDSNYVVFGGTYCTFRWVGAMVGEWREEWRRQTQRQRQK